MSLSSLALRRTALEVLQRLSNRLFSSTAAPAEHILAAKQNPVLKVASNNAPTGSVRLLSTSRTTKRDITRLASPSKRVVTRHLSLSSPLIIDQSKAGMSASALHCLSNFYYYIPLSQYSDELWPVFSFLDAQPQTMVVFRQRNGSLGRWKCAIHRKYTGEEPIGRHEREYPPITVLGVRKIFPSGHVRHDHVSREPHQRRKISEAGM